MHLADRQHSFLSGPIALVIGRGASSFAASMTAFALDVAIFAQTGSYAWFAALAAASMIPGLIIAPIAGVFIDRISKKFILVSCEVVAIVATLSVALWHSAGIFNVWIVAAAMVTYSSLEAVRWPTISASLTLLADKDELVKVNGIAEACRSLTLVMAPLAGATLMTILGIEVILLVAALVLSVSLWLLATIQFPKMTNRLARSLTSVFSDLTAAGRWLQSAPFLLKLLLYFAAANFTVSVFIVTQAPYVLSFGTPVTLSVCMAAGGAGILLGGLLFARFGRQFGAYSKVILIGAAAQALVIGVWSLSRSLPVLVLSAFIGGICSAYVNATSQTLWQTSVPSQLQGRIFSFRFVVASCLTPVAVMASIPLSGLIMAPLIDRSSFLSDIWGSGLAGSLGLMISTLACGLMVISLILLYRGSLEAEPPT